MAERRTLNVNGRSRTITVDDPDMPLLLALRENLNLNGPLFGCGLAQCGACTVHVDGKAVRSCVLPLSKVGPAQKVVTIEGLAQGNRLHPVQRAFVEEQAVQCGYCINGMIMESVAFLAGNKNPVRGGHQEGARQQYLPLRHPHPHRARGQARRRSSVREAAMTKHFTPSRRDLLKGGGALIVSFSLTVRRALAAAGGGAAAAVDRRGRRVPRDRRSRPGDALFRQGRSRHRRAHRARADVRRGARRAVQRSASRRRRHGANAGPGHDLGQPHHPGRRHADPQRGGDRPRGADRAGRQAARRQAGRPQRVGWRDPRRQSPRQLWRADRRQDVLAQARPRQAGEVQGPEGLQDRRQADPRASTSRTR